MTTGTTDTDIIEAEPQQLTLENGFPIKIERLKTRATMTLLKILTRGAGELLPSLFSDTDEEDSDAFGGRLVAAVILSIPDAQDETIDFIKRMVSPAQLHEGSRITKGDQEWNKDLWDQLDAELDDPELDDLVTIVSRIVEAEAPHILALGKRLQALGRVIRPTPTESEQPKKSSSRSSRASTPEDS